MDTLFDGAQHNPSHRGQTSGKVGQLQDADGQHLAFNHDNNNPLCNLFITMLQRLGIETDVFGSSTGSLNEIQQ